MVAGFREVLAIRQKLANEFPAVPANQVELGDSCCNYGNLLRDGGKPADSLLWYDKAIRTLARVHQQEPPGRDPTAVPPQQPLGLGKGL